LLVVGALIALRARRLGRPVACKQQGLAQAARARSRF
jgi:hypothetical protein